MKRITILLIAFLATTTLFGQNNDNVQKSPKGQLKAAITTKRNAVQLTKRSSNTAAIP